MCEDVQHSLLCETVTAATTAGLRAARDASRADMVELRVDGVAGLDVAGALAGRSGPVLVTCRPVWEGGRFDGTEAERRAILEAALALGAEFVDVEWRAGFDDLVQRHASRVVLSMHDFDRVPVDLETRVRDMRSKGAGTIKVAVMARRLADMLSLLPIGRESSAVVIAMGDSGVPSRLLASRFGSRWTYAGRGVAPGQIPADRMIDEFRFRDARADTRVFGVVSRNAMVSLSPSMHNAAFAAAGIDAMYVPLSAASFDDFLEFASAIGVDGASVTIPFKLDALRAAANPDGVAREVGASNTLRRRDRVWDATNTDVAGFLAPLDEAFESPLSGARAAVLGAGGAARAVVVGLRSRGARVTVHARRADQAADVARELGAVAAPWPPDPGSWDLLVNTTPLGGPSARSESPVPGARLDGRLVYDLTYGPGESRLIADARASGCRTLDGLAMLVAQAERQFEWWTGTRPQAGVMRAAAERRLEATDDGTRERASEGTALTARERAAG